ncbi:sodium:alanine symporter family protein [Paracoccus sp. (in: a-proteobacteria)]|uniref:alanine/glycine:cation symporter family protein n=1 Tax=Paracoccus sp. TaxID=267 RepID=UPI0026E0DAAB|nr:alanine/glycine:cation symporter family protein [Paracoccus sp. (in: a-proteobacteria)]MDO5646945.1 alanine/glycine:cation symporter family protein [Paracoccus sp. (in: a-proteobacteria)]
MNRMMQSLLLAAVTAVITASHAAAQGLDQKIDTFFAKVTGPYVGLIFSDFPGTNFPWIVAWLVIGATVFTLYFGFVQFRAFGLAIRLVRGDYSNPKDAGEVSHFQALATALSGTVGLGNIAGVAVAIGIGGPGATFWMIVAGLLGMAAKFTECTLGVKYRNEYADGTVSGGPMYYISKGFAERGIPGGRVLAAAFAVFCILGCFGVAMFGTNQTHGQLINVMGDFPGWITGAITAIAIGLVIVGGIKSIASVTEKVVPFMAVLYVGGALTIIFMNWNMVGTAFNQIITGAFTVDGAVGGAIGALIQGFRRAAFSNEAGVGSAAIAHSAVRTKEPVTEGFVSLLEPFIDTVIICTMTALVIIITGQLVTDPETGLFLLNESGRHIQTVTGNQGVALTSDAYATVSPWFPYVLTVAVILFGFSTTLAWSYYGLKSFTYLVGEGQAKENIFKVVFCFFCVIGGAASLGAVLDFTDSAIFSMAVVNIIGLYLLMPVVRAEMNSFLARLKSGEIKTYKH